MLLKYLKTKMKEEQRLTTLEITKKMFMQENEKQHIAIMESMTKFHTSTNASIKEMVEKLDKAIDKKANKWVETSMV